MNMNLNWVFEHKNGQITKKKEKGKLTVYNDTRSGKHAKRDNVKTIALQDEQENTQLIVNVPDGAAPFLRHRGNRAVNYFNKFHDVSLWIDYETGEVKSQQIDHEKSFVEPENPMVFDPKTRQSHPKLKKVDMVVPEATYMEFWIVGYHTPTEVYFKALYPDGKIDEHHGWGEKPWLYEPEWFTEEQV